MKVFQLMFWSIVGVLFVSVAPALAQEGAGAVNVLSGPGFGGGIGAGIVIIGAALGISTIAGKAVESMARQPEVAGNINTAMIISAALIEGVTFFALVVCMIK